MLIRFSLLISVICLLYLSCMQDTAATDGPEQVARQWQQYLDNNEFEKAKTISTQRTKDLIDMMASIMFDDMEEMDLPPTEFLEMDCMERQDSASCVYLIDVDGEQVRDSFLLVRMEGQWYVDLAEDEPYLDEEEEAEMYERFNEMLKEAVEDGDTSLMQEL